MSTGLVGTGLSHGMRADPQHAAQAVAQAIERADIECVRGVVLFLTAEYAEDPSPALRAAARQAGCMQVVGCSGPGLITDQDWVLDSPGAAAMVFGDPISLNPLMKGENDKPVLSLCTPQGLTADWLDAPLRRVGAVSADLAARGPFCVWSGARVADCGTADAVIGGVEDALSVSQGIRALTAPIEVAEADGYEIMRLGNYPALNVLIKSLPAGTREMDQIPLHLLIGGVTFGDPETAISEGRYRLNHIISADSTNRSITLSHPMMRGDRLFWAMRDALASERDMAAAIERARGGLSGEPDFGLLFPCIGRGPSFYGNRDRDVELMKARFPGMPFIGFYGNGEIGPLDGANQLHQYSTVVSLFRSYRH